MPAGGLPRPGFWLAAALLALAALAWWPTAQRETPVAPLNESDLAALAARVAALSGHYRNPAPPVGLPAYREVYVALWTAGRRTAHAWGSGPDAGGAIADAFGRLRDAGTSADTVELSLAYGFRRLDTGALGDELSPAQRGVRGLEVSHRGRTLRFAPSQMVADNLSFERALSRAAKMLGIDGQTLVRDAGLRTFDARQVVVSFDPLPVANELFRGKHTLPATSVRRDAVAGFAHAMGDWMLGNLHPDGRMTYMYYPASGRESTSNNMIRQWMASLALVRMAHTRGDGALLAAARRNIRFNLDHYYHAENGLGLVDYRDQVKLGATALAALALLEFDGGAEFAAELQALVATTDTLWREDGSFRNFYRPESRNGEVNLHNFYPGETLLLWASLLRARPDAERARRFDLSLAHYREWHLAHRRPAFVPWQTQAAYLRWQETGSPALAQWIFEMNDWLLAMQAHSRAAYDDTLGRFYDPRHPEFGPPHASSTGVYMEGLVDAWEVARALGDEPRAKAYGQAIRSGLRSAMQLQFRDDGGMWFVRDPARVRGGLRTTVYNNVIRVDNVQHTLMAVQKILATPVSGPGVLLPAALP